MNKNRKNIKWLILVLLFISALLIQNLFIVNRNKNYPLLEKSNEIIGKVTYFKAAKGGCYIALKDLKLRIGTSQNYQYDSKYIYMNIFIGDSIIKKSGSDTIRILRDSEEYIFVHEKVINEHLRWKNN